MDDCTRYTWITLLKHKSEAPTHIVAFSNMVHSQFGKIIKIYRTDNARELNLGDFLASKDTIHQYSCVERPQQNAVVERKHQHLLKVARALFVQAECPLVVWGECVSTAAHLIILCLLHY